MIRQTLSVAGINVLTREFRARSRGVGIVVEIYLLYYVPKNYKQSVGLHRLLNFNGTYWSCHIDM